tara:strand:- start:517 stop:729 length:213 start_codon:yes stop_codon:yes gene_type:complete
MLTPDFSETSPIIMSSLFSLVTAQPYLLEHTPAQPLNSKTPHHFGRGVCMFGRSDFLKNSGPFSLKEDDL